MVWWIVFGIIALLLLLLLLPVRLRLLYEGELRIRLGYGPVSGQIFPPNKKKKRRGKKARPAAKKKKKGGGEKAGRLSQILKEDGVGAVVGYLKNFAALLSESAGRLAHIMVIDRLLLEIRLAGEDAAAVATDYGKVCAVVYPALSLIESAVKTRKSEVRVSPDFLAEKSAVRFDVRVHAMALRILLLIPRLIFRLAANTTPEETTGETPSQDKPSVKTGKDG